jgi:SAM-dependent methyltransferase
VSEEDEVRSTYERYEATGRARLWDPANKGYAQLSRGRDDAILGLVTRSLPPGSGRLLDVGCGDGHLARLLAEHGTTATYAGIDLLVDRIEAARESTPDTSFVVGSADAMPFEDSAFDVAAAITLFSSLPSAALEERVAHEIARVIRPGGWLVWYDLRYGNPTNPAVHGVRASRLRELFPGWAPELRSLSLAPPVARRLGPLTPVAYPALHAVPFLRSHLVGRLRCPE